MITKKIAVQVIQADRFGNSNWQIGQTADLSSICMAQEGHSFVFMDCGELFEVFSDLTFK
jgi:hypothetical protein